MTTDELRAKFEAWWVYHFRDGNGPPPSRRLSGTGIYTVEVDEILWTTWQAAHTSRDAEVEALKWDAERYRWLRGATNRDWTVGKDSEKGGVYQYYGQDVDAAIDAAMREGK